MDQWYPAPLVGNPAQIDHPDVRQTHSGALPGLHRTDW
jgi:hypothetical protein